MPNWTIDQEKAIYEPAGEGNILVSAAAGSGKTAVLVERIAQMVLRDENPVSIDKLLVVTFTEAAAAEMKERIIDRLSSARAAAAEKGDRDKSAYLRDQIYLTSTADINTIDAFCLNVVKNNFHILGVDPNFGIMDNGEIDILTDDAMDTLFDALYSTDNEEDKKRFLRLVEIYASNRDDEGLKKVIKKLYEFIQPFADPEKWLDDKMALYDDDMASSPWVNQFILTDLKDRIIQETRGEFISLRDELSRLAGEWEEERRTAAEDNGEDMAKFKAFNETNYWGSLWEKTNNCIDAARKLSDCRVWNDYIGFYKSCIVDQSYMGTGRNKYSKKNIVDEGTWRKYYDRLNANRAYFKAECADLPNISPEEFNEFVHGREVHEIIGDIVWLTKLYTRVYDEMKSKRNVKSFSDVEHLAYRLFADNENIRGEYAEKYEEILIDEFQDTNGLQDSIFTLISRDNKNIFMVGDLKQSIYRFRGGDPTIFKRKSREYSRGMGGKLIYLSQNFRSRLTVIDSINTLFFGMMSDEVGDVEYTGDEALCREGDREVYPPCEGETFDRRAEMYRIAVIGGGEDDEEVTKARAEAHFVAGRIKELIDSGYKVSDGKEYRPIRYSDIVILMKSVKNDGGAFRDALDSLNVPSFVQKEEYFERREIKLMLSLLTLINNHLQDIPLLAVMRSPIGGFTDSELAMIRLMSGKRPFYNAVKEYEAGEDADENEKRLEKKCKRLVLSLEKWRRYVKHQSIASLIWTLYEETKIYDFMGALEGGEEAQANLKLLYERAKRYEESGFKGIFNFIRYIERMENRREDIAGAQLVNENHNVVRVMTIHKSKGLEFPVVFLSGCGKKLKVFFPGEERRITLHNEMGIGAIYYNYEQMYSKKLIHSEYIRKRNEAEHLSEQMRLMYVAVTRAKEKLIVTSSHSIRTEEKYQNQLDKWSELCEKSPREVARKAICMGDWVMAAASRNSDSWLLEDVVIDSVKNGEETTEENTVAEENGAGYDFVKEILEYSYPYPKSGNLPAKTSVTAIKEMEDAENIRINGEGEREPVFMASKPAFMRGENMGARIGTAHHAVMAFIDLNAMKSLSENAYEEFVADEIKRIADEGQIEDEIAADEEITQKICENVCGFFKSGMGKRVLQAKKTYREQPFEIEISAREYDRSLTEEYENEKIVVQGIIDLFFEEENGDIILVDYKTDRCAGSEDEMKIGKKYRPQLELYEGAMKKILKRDVKNKYLYLFSSQSVLELD